jgi:hypothetical protein
MLRCFRLRLVYFECFAIWCDSVRDDNHKMMLFSDALKLEIIRSTNTIPTAAIQQKTQQTANWDMSQTYRHDDEDTGCGFSFPTNGTMLLLSRELPFWVVTVSFRKARRIAMTAKM